MFVFRSFSTDSRTVQALDPSLALLIAILTRDQRIAEPLLRIPKAKGKGKASQSMDDDSEMYEARTCDVVVVLGDMLKRSWAGEEIGGATGKGVVASKGLSKSDVRLVR